MAQLYFRYGTMGSGKSLELIKVAYNYNEQGRDVIVFKPSLDNRSSGVFSRTGFHVNAISINEETNLFEITRKRAKDQQISCVLVDEAQFLTKHHVWELANIVDMLEIPVIAFGLKNDFRNNLFEGSQELLILADKVEEIKTICYKCERKATMVVRLVDGVPTLEGNQIVVDNEENRERVIYKPTCRKCYCESFKDSH